ncbi:MAG: hypothetical protein ABR520_06235 [Mycobacteriales bacterium]
MSAPGAPLDGALALAGTLWRGGDAAPEPGSVVVVNSDGLVTAAGPVHQVEAPQGARRVGGADSWVVPTVADAHVHLAFASRAARTRYSTSSRR